MLLLELFNMVSPSNWKWRFKGSEEAEAEFTVGKVRYIFYAYNDTPDRLAQVHWTLEFKAPDEDTRYGLTGTGNSQQVMSTVVSIIKDFLKEYTQITKISFAAKEESRKGLYGRMIHRLLPTWKLETKEDRHQGQIYTLTKPIE